ncbi:hypothetical protein T265_13713, partial [Opisthorchis viverrini]
LDNLAESQPSYFLQVAWQLGTERVRQLTTWQIPALILSSGSMAVARVRCLVVGLFAGLGSWIANVSSPIEVTSSYRRYFVKTVECGRFGSTHSSAVAPFRFLIAMPPEGSTRAVLLPGCSSLGRESREPEVGFEP